MTGKPLEKKLERLDEVWCRRKQKRHVAVGEKKAMAAAPASAFVGSEGVEIPTVLNINIILIY